MQRNLKAVSNAAPVPAPTVTQIDEINRQLDRARVMAHLLYDQEEAEGEYNAHVLPIVIEALQKATELVGEIKTGSFE